MGCLSPEARAEPAPLQASQQPLQQPSASASREPVAETYKVPLALAYVLTPALAAATGAVVFELTDNTDVSIAAGALMFVLPATVHGYYVGHGRALLSFGSMLGVTLVGATLVGGLGYLLANLGCERGTPEYEEEGCGISIGVLTRIGAITGATLGYAGYAIYDVKRNATLPDTSAPSADALPLKLWLAPVAEVDPRQRQTRLTGARLVGALQF
jgi:hypothetical protein